MKNIFPVSVSSESEMILSCSSVIGNSMPPIVPIDKGLVVLLGEGLTVDYIDNKVLDSYVEKGCSTLLIGDGNGVREIGNELLEIKSFESKSGKIGVYYGKNKPDKVESKMVELLQGGLKEGIEDKEHKLSICMAEKSDVELLNQYLKYHLEHPDRPHTPWIMLVVPCNEKIYTRKSVLSTIDMDEEIKEELNSEKKVVGVSISMCPDTCRVDELKSFDWKSFVESSGGISLRPGDAVFELCYRVGLSPKFGD